MGRRSQTAETRGTSGIYAHRLLDEKHISVFKGVQDAITESAGRRRFHLRSDRSAGLSLMSSAKMRQILGDSPDLHELGVEEVAARMRGGITTGEQTIPLRVIRTDVITSSWHYLVAYVMHADILKDRLDLMRTLRGLGGQCLGGNEWDPHITFAMFNKRVPPQIIGAVESAMPESFAVGPVVVDVMAGTKQGIRTPDQVQIPDFTGAVALRSGFALQEG